MTFHFWDSVASKPGYHFSLIQSIHVKMSVFNVFEEMLGLELQRSGFWIPSMTFHDISINIQLQQCDGIEKWVLYCSRIKKNRIDKKLIVWRTGIIYVSQSNNQTYLDIWLLRQSCSIVHYCSMSIVIGHKVYIQSYIGQCSLNQGRISAMYKMLATLNHVVVPGALNMGLLKCSK